ncbi:MAG: site-specific DNA-methyltransferase [Deltaproteobacteria bacterium]|nr:site-specific DNA-methyltransferase [Deltaproteobacteria bacterium]
MLQDVQPVYLTRFGKAFLGNALELLDRLESGIVNLVITSPPFALQRKKEYGNEPQDEYVDWLAQFADKVTRVLKEDGSFVLDLGGAYEKGRPIRSLYNYRILIKFCDEIGLKLAEEFFWFNPARLPSPIEWVNKRKIRVKDAVNTVWWFSKSDYPKANVENVLVPYSERMKKLLKNANKYYSPRKRPSGHDISAAFAKANGGAIPPNLLEIPNTESNSKYLRYCKLVASKGHPARFPTKLPEFFIRFLTEPSDLVLDIFAGSNATGEAAEANRRNWIAFENERRYLAESAFRFIQEADVESAKLLYRRLLDPATYGVDLATTQWQMDLWESVRGTRAGTS